MSSSLSLPITDASLITRETISSLIEAYPKIFNHLQESKSKPAPKTASRSEPAPSTDLTHLDKLRYETIPATLKSRRDESAKSETWFEKKELVNLVQWKMWVAPFPILECLSLNDLVACVSLKCIATCNLYIN
jgi:hypothetical protein